MSLQERKRALSQFSEDSETKIMLISLMAGSVGLNLVSANNVLLVDPWWNPAVEEQAIERLHRIGQIRDVNVYKFISVNTVEEKMMEVQERKRELRNRLFDCQKEEIKRQNFEDFKRIFKAN